MKKVNLLIGTFVSALLIGCGGGGGGSGNKPSNNENNTNLNKFVFPKLEITSIKKPIKSISNTYEINFVGNTYLKFALKAPSIFIYKNGGIEYMESSKLLDKNGNELNFTNGDILPQGEYILKVHSDTNLEKYHPYITFIANTLEYTNVATLTLINQKIYYTQPGFRSFFKIHIDENMCIGIEGGYQDVYLYTIDLNKTNYDLNNNIECDIPSGNYYLYYHNDTISSNKFTIYYEKY